MKRISALLLAAAFLRAEGNPTPLTAEENERLLIALVNYHQSRAAMLEALAASRAGNTDIERADSATKQVQSLVSELQKAHGASPECSWDYGVKKWACGK
jgi:hypothetical protein